MEGGCLYIGLVRILWFSFSSFQPGRACAKENQGGPSQGDPGRTKLAGAAVVRNVDESGEKEDLLQETSGKPEEPQRSRGRHLVTQAPIGGLPFLGKKLVKAGFDKETVELIMSAWRPGTKKVYTTYLRKWATFCIENRVKLLEPKLPEVCKFLSLLAKRGLGYGAINAARSALATILTSVEGFPLGKHPVVCLLVKGVYERNPPAPRYQRFWDVSKVFRLFKAWGKNKNLTFKLLTLKLAVLLLLVSSQRGQSIVALNLEGMVLEGEITFKMKTLMKHNRLGNRLDTLTFKPFELCSRLCVVRTIKNYLERSQKVRKEEKQLLLSYVPPHKGISRDTLARWTVSVMKMAGINTDAYKSHSTRGATASASKRLGVGINLIIKHAGWKNAESFANYYDKDIESEDGQPARALLENAT